MPAVEKVAVNDHGFLPASASVQALLAPKATATLCKRMCSMRTHSGWYNLSRLPQSAALFEEAHVFTNVKEIYNDGAPASRGAALCEAINFVGRLLGVCVDAVRKSSRVRGMGCTLLRTRAATRRRRPLTVSMVMELGEGPSSRMKEEENLMLLLLGRPCLLSTASSGQATFGGASRNPSST